MQPCRRGQAHHCLGCVRAAPLPAGRSAADLLNGPPAGSSAAAAAAATAAMMMLMMMSPPATQLSLSPPPPSCCHDGRLPERCRQQLCCSVRTAPSHRCRCGDLLHLRSRYYLPRPRPKRRSDPLLSRFRELCCDCLCSGCCCCCLRNRRRGLRSSCCRKLLLLGHECGCRSRCIICSSRRSSGPLALTYAVARLLPLLRT